METTTLAARIAAAMAERKGVDITTIDLRGRASYADYLVVATGTSDRHVQAIAEGIERDLSAQGTRCTGREGLREGQWALIDYGTVVAHVFHSFTRPLYDLESLWRQAPQSRLAGSETGPEPDGDGSVGPSPAAPPM